MSLYICNVQIQSALRNMTQMSYDVRTVQQQHAVINMLQTLQLKTSRPSASETGAGWEQVEVKEFTPIEGCGLVLVDPIMQAKLPELVQDISFVRRYGRRHNESEEMVEPVSVCYGTAQERHLRSELQKALAENELLKAEREQTFVDSCDLQLKYINLREELGLSLDSDDD